MPEPQILLAAAQFVAFFGGGFFFAGRITKNLEVLSKGHDDHETRIRVIEREGVHPDHIAG